MTPFGTSQRRDELTRAALRHWWAGRPSEALKSLATASTLDPASADVAIAIASTHVLDNNLSSALACYEEVLRQHPHRDDARVPRAVYAALAGDPTQAAEDWAWLDTHRPELSAHWRRVASIAHHAVKMPLSQDPPLGSPQNHAYVVLGFALSADGTPTQPLLDRLNTALRCHRLDPSSDVILSGGQARSDSTEAAAMYRYLLSQGVPKNRMIIEDASFDTIENVLFTLRAAEDNRIGNLTVITGAEHFRRAAALFNVGTELLRSSGRRPITVIHHVTAGLADGISPVATKNEEISIHRDALRLSGLWAFPGIQR